MKDFEQCVIVLCTIHWFAFNNVSMQCVRIFWKC